VGLDFFDFSSLNVALNLAMLIAVVRFVRVVRRLASRWSFQHRQRTPAAALYGMARVLQLQHQQLPFEARVAIYDALVEEAERLVAAIDAGDALEQEPRHDGGRRLSSCFPIRGSLFRRSRTAASRAAMTVARQFGGSTTPGPRLS
jgi:hypothetical protein